MMKAAEGIHGRRMGGHDTAKREPGLVCWRSRQDTLDGGCARWSAGSLESLTRRRPGDPEVLEAGPEPRWEQGCVKALQSQLTVSSSLH